MHAVLDVGRSHPCWRFWPTPACWWSSRILLARGPLLVLLFREGLTHAEAAKLGLIMGAVGLLEALFPDAHFSYATHTLFVPFAAMVGGLRVGLLDGRPLSVWVPSCVRHRYW